MGYNTYKIEEDGYILTLPIGYADGVNKNYKYVYINGEYLKIVGDCMDMLLIFSPKKIQVGTKVEIFGSHIPISSVCKVLGINAYHLFNQISNRVVSCLLYTSFRNYGKLFKIFKSRARKN